MSKIPESQSPNSVLTRAVLVLALAGLAAGCGKTSHHYELKESEPKKVDPVLEAAKKVVRTAGDNEITEAYCSVLDTRNKDGIMGSIANLGKEYQATAFRAYLEKVCRRALGPDKDTTNNKAECAKLVETRGLKKLCGRK